MSFVGIIYMSIDIQIVWIIYIRRFGKHRQNACFV